MANSTTNTNDKNTEKETTKMTETTNRKSWKTEAENQEMKTIAAEAKARKFRNYVSQTLDALKAADDWGKSKTEEARTKGQDDTVHALTEATNYVRFLMESLIQDIEGVDDDHKVGDCDRKIEEQKQSRIDRGLSLMEVNHTYGLGELCAICRNGRKETRLVMYTNHVRKYTADVNQKMLDKESQRGLKDVKDVLKSL